MDHGQQKIYWSTLDHGWDQASGQKTEKMLQKEQEGKKWKTLKEKTTEMIKENKWKYIDSEVERLTQAGSNQIPYRALKEIAIAERPKPWNINMVSPGTPYAVSYTHLTLPTTPYV